MSDMTVAKTILAQLGGSRFRVMTGAKNFVGDSNSVSFRIPGGGGFAKGGINVVMVRLEPSDTYTMFFSRQRGKEMKAIDTRSLVYADQLEAVFTAVTGLQTRL